MYLLGYEKIKKNKIVHRICSKVKKNSEEKKNIIKIISLKETQANSKSTEMESPLVAKQQALNSLRDYIQQTRAGNPNYTGENARPVLDNVFTALTNAGFDTRVFGPAYDAFAASQGTDLNILDRLGAELNASLQAPVQPIGSFGSTNFPQSTQTLGSPVTQPGFGSTPSTQLGFGPTQSGGLGSPTTTTTATSFPSGFQAGPNPFGQRPSQPTQNLSNRIDSRNVRGGVNALVTLSATLTKMGNPSDDSDDSKKKFFEAINNALIDRTTGADLLVPYYQNNPQTLTADRRQYIMNVITDSYKLTSVVDSQGNVIGTEENVLTKGFQTFKFSFGEKKKDGTPKINTRQVKTIDLVLMKRPAIDISSDQKLKESSENRTRFDALASAAYSKKNLQSQVRAIKLLMKANSQFGRALAEKTGFEKEAAIGIPAAGNSTTNPLVKNGYFIVTRDDYEAMENNALILVQNMVFAGSLGRKQISQIKSFRGKGNKLFVMDGVFLNWLRNETFGIITNTSGVAGCLTARGPVEGEKSARRFTFTCQSPAFWAGFRELAALKYAELSNGSPDEYEQVLRNAFSDGNDAMLVERGFAKEKLLRALFYLAKSFGRLNNQQNIDPNAGQDLKIRFGSQKAQPAKDPNSKKKANVINNYTPTDAMREFFGRVASRFAFSKEQSDDKEKLVENRDGASVLQVVARSVMKEGYAGEESKTRMDVDTIPQMAFAKITKVTSYQTYESEYMTMLQVLDPKVPSDAPFGNTTIGKLRTALYAEAEALEEVKIAVDTVVSNAKTVRDQRKSEIEKNKKTANVQSPSANQNVSMVM